MARRSDHAHTFTGPDLNWAPPGCAPCDGKTGTPDLRAKRTPEQWAEFYRSAMEDKPAQPHLVPVRLGGPWKRDGKEWEFWNAGEHVCGNQNGYRVHGGELQLLFETWTKDTCLGDAPHTGRELRAPKDWTGDLPQGTRLATDLIVGQRVRQLATNRMGTITEFGDKDWMCVEFCTDGKHWYRSRGWEGC